MKTHIGDVVPDKIGLLNEIYYHFNGTKVENVRTIRTMENLPELLSQTTSQREFI